jgi:hypothetical protein
MEFDVCRCTVRVHRIQSCVHDATPVEKRYSSRIQLRQYRARRLNFVPEPACHLTDWAPVRIGITAAQVRAVVAGPIEADKVGGGPGCYYLIPKSSKGIAFMMLNDPVG